MELHGGTFIVNRPSEFAHSGGRPRTIGGIFSDPESHGEGSQAESAEDGTSGEEELEDVLEVTPQLDSGSTTPTKPRPVPAPNVRACSKSSPRRLKSKRLKSPGDTPGRAVAVRQNAADLMDEEVARWAVAAAEPKKELFY